MNDAAALAALEALLAGRSTQGQLDRTHLSAEVGTSSSKPGTITRGYGAG
jgi:hypothetical protein